MGLRFFHRFPIIGRFVTLNVSKTGVSVSAGVPGAHITTGTHGTRATVGLPGTGLFYTEHLDTALRRAQQHQAVNVQALVAGYQQCARPEATAEELVAALDRQHALGLSDADLPSDVREARDAIREYLQARFGYRVEKRVTTIPVSRPVNVALPLAIIIVIIAGALLATWFLL
jgi:hypothetical protein